MFGLLFLIEQLHHHIGSKTHIILSDLRFYSVDTKLTLDSADVVLRRDRRLLKVKVLCLSLFIKSSLLVSFTSLPPFLSSLLPNDLPVRGRDKEEVSGKEEPFPAVTHTRRIRTKTSPAAQIWAQNRMADDTAPRLIFLRWNNIILSARPPGTRRILCPNAPPRWTHTHAHAQRRDLWGVLDVNTFTADRGQTALFRQKHTNMRRFQ